MAASKGFHCFFANVFQICGGWGYFRNSHYFAFKGTVPISGLLIKRSHEA